MRQIALSLIFVAAFLTPARSQKNSPFEGRWDFNIAAASGATSANWLSVTEKNGALDVWYQPSGGHVYQVTNVKANGSHLALTVSQPAAKGAPTTWDLDAAGDKLTGVQKRGDVSTPLTGSRAPELKRSAPKAWNNPESLFNGVDLTGWEPIGNVANNHWVVKDKLLVNEDRGANLKSTKKFDDFKLHFEVYCPDHANSGFYLRGRYEIQLESEGSGNPVERQMGSIYGRIAPKEARKTGEWDSFDVTLVGRTVTIVRNGVTAIDHKEIEGITGGALDANEEEPGSFYIQGDHTGGLKFRNITVATPKR